MAAAEIEEQSPLNRIPGTTGRKIAIIGSGPAGLSAAFYLLRSGVACVLFDRHEEAGGTLRYDIPEDQLPRAMLDAEIAIIRRMGAEFRLATTVTEEMFQNGILPVFDAVILATGSRKTNPAVIPGFPAEFHLPEEDKKHLHTSVPGVFACGNIIRDQRMAVHSVAQGKMAARQVMIYLEGETQSVSHHQKLDHPGITAFKPVSMTGHLLDVEKREYLKEGTLSDRVIPAGGHPGGYTHEEAIEEATRCMHCDCRKPVTCKLRIYATEYEVSRRRFRGAARNPVIKSVQHETVVYESEKCIRCGLCVEITERHGELIGLSYAGKGFDVRIKVPFNQTIREALTLTARECVDTCPTGALAFKTGEERGMT